MEQSKASFVYCLSIDLIGSTKAGIELTTSQLDRFNRSLVEQINPHIEKLELNDVLVKFTGDGWLLMTNDIENVPVLCCLAKIMANNFQREMSQKTGLKEDRIPSLRLAICSGRDVSVELPDKMRDWVGDSARRATRASSYCYSNEILIDDPVRYQVFRDFNIEYAEVDKRPPEYQPKKIEEHYALSILGDLKPEAAADSESAGYFVYMLSAIGKEKSATEVAQQGLDLIIDEVNEPRSVNDDKFIKISKKWNRLVSRIPEYSKSVEMLNNGQLIGLLPNVVTYNTLIYKSPDYDEARSWFEKMVKEGIKPDVVTYNTLIYKSPDYGEARSWFEKMAKEGVQPNIFSYNTMISQSPDYDKATSWFEKMVEKGTLPNIVTYNTLISQSPDYDKATSWFEKMAKEGVQPDIFSYNTLISQSPDYDKATSWFEKVAKEGAQPDIITYSTMISQSPDYDKATSWFEKMVKEGVQPDIVTYNTLISQSPDYDEATSWFENMVKEGVQPDIVTYSTLISQSPDYDEATSWFEKMVKEGVQPNIVTYSTLISQSPDYDEATSWFEKMVKEGVQPNIVTYSTLISQSPDYDEATSWFEKMVKEGVQPDIVTYNTLISQSPDYDEAMRWLNRMHDDGISPDQWSYQSLFKKDLSEKSADDILEWYLSQQYHPEQALQAAITAYIKCHRIDQALRLSLDYPHLQSARKVIRKNSQNALLYYTSILNKNPDHPNAHYALGVALMELGRYKEAKQYLEAAFLLTRSGRRKTIIKTWLRQIDPELSKNDTR